MDVNMAPDWTCLILFLLLAWTGTVVFAFLVAHCTHSFGYTEKKLYIHNAFQTNFKPSLNNVKCIPERPCGY